MQNKYGYLLTKLVIGKQEFAAVSLLFTVLLIIVFKIFFTVTANSGIQVFVKLLGSLLFLIVMPCTGTLSVPC